MLAASHVEVHVLPVCCHPVVHQGVVVAGIHVSQVVGAGAGKAGHGEQLYGEYGLIIDKRLVHDLAVHFVPCPYLGVAEGRLATLCGQEVLYLGQFHGQTLFGNHAGNAVLVVDGERFAPVALAGEYGVAQAEVHLHAAQAVLADKLFCCGDGLFHAQTVQREALEGCLARHGRVHHGALLGIVALLTYVGSFDQRNDGQVEVTCKGIVA